MIDFPAAKNKFTFYLDRKGKRVTIDINSNSKVFSKQLSVPTLNETSVIRSLAIGFSKNTLTLYLDCQDVLKEEVEFNLSKLFLDMEEPLVKLFRERKYPLYLDTSPDNALSRASCQKNLRRKSNHKIVKDNERKNHIEGKFITRICLILSCHWQKFIFFYTWKGSEKNRKRDVNQYYRGRDNRDRNVDAPPGRGDIPIMHGDCDGKY